MILTSVSFFMFLAAIWCVFQRVSQPWKLPVLLAGSYFFYGMFSWKAVWVLFAVSVLNYLGGLFIDASGEKNKKRFLLALILANVLVLVYFKYTNFIIENLNYWSREDWSLRDIVLPLGISFYIFQAIAYVVDVYLEKSRPVRHLGTFLVYMSFFPKLLQGPIERAGFLAGQLRGPFQFNRRKINEGVQLILTGLVKKVVIADRLNIFTSTIFDGVDGYSGMVLWLAVYAFTFQIYFDFAGYTDLARGMGKLFGIELSENFAGPYMSTNIQEFWRRWHMTFSFWLRDYLFTPLMAAFRGWGAWGSTVAVMVTFAVCGIWHGASWGFVVFGLLHGVYMAFSILTLKRRDRWYKTIGIPSQCLKVWRMGVTFHLVAFSFIFFRAGSLSDAIYILSNLLVGEKSIDPFSILSCAEMFVVLSAALLLALVRPVINVIEKGTMLQYVNYWFYGALANLIIFFGVRFHAPFIYFKF